MISFLDPDHTGDTDMKRVDTMTEPFLSHHPGLHVEVTYY